MNTLQHLSPGSVRLDGALGEAIRLTIRNRLLRVDYGLAVDAFRHKLDKRADGWCWRGEFWGKTVRSAVRAWEAAPSDELRAVIDHAVIDLLSTQDADGRISSFPPEDQPESLDIWNRKYVILGLVRYCESMNPAPAVRDAAARCLASLMAQVRPAAGRPLHTYGTHRGMSSASILGAVLKVYRLTGDRRFLDFAKFLYADDDGAAPVFRAIESGLPPAQILDGKAYEMMSCAEGMLELYRDTGDAHLLDAVRRHYRDILEHEIYITGMGGLKDTVGEYWGEGRARQTHLEGTGALGETCVIVTWIRFALNLLRETRDATIADEIERSLYNGMLGAMTPDGSGYTHRNPTPLAGPCWRKVGAYQIRGYGDFDCCLAQGPEGIATAARFAALADGDGGLFVNLYEPATIRLPGGGEIAIEGGYPYAGGTVLRLRLDAPRRFALSLRIPGWSAATACRLNGEAAPVKPGTYATFDREWCDGDVVELDFDYSGRIVRPPDGSPYAAFLKGPIVYCRDSFLSGVSEPLPTDGAWKAATFAMPNAFRSVIEISDGTRLADYASAGNKFDPCNMLRVWLDPA